MKNIHDLKSVLGEMRLKGMEQSLEKVLERATRAGMSFQDFLYDLLLEEKKYKQEKSMLYRLKQARLPYEWTLETFPFHLQPEVKKTQIMTMAGLEFIQQGTNIVFVGKPGTGKTGLAIGLMRKALIQGYKGKFYKAQDLLDDLYASLADRSTSKLLKRLSNFDLLLIDELGYLTLNQNQMNMFFKLMDERYTKSRPSIITTNLNYDDWYNFLKPKSMVDALLDRLKHKCITISIQKGDSLRNPTV